MATAASVNIDLAVNTAKMQAGFASAQRQTQKFLNNFAAGIGIGFGIQAAHSGFDLLKRLTMEAIQNADALDHLSQRLGISVNQLSVFQVAAKKTDIELEQVADGIAKMTVNVSEAARGAGPAIKALQLLGLSAKQLRNLTPDQQFIKIADALNKVANKSDKLALIVDIFGKSGRELHNFIELGSRGMEDMRRLAEQFGLALDDNAVKRLRELNDSIDELHLALKGLGTVLAVSLAPAVKRIMADWIFQIQLLLKLIDTIDKAFQNFGKGFTRPFGGLFDPKQPNGGGALNIPRPANLPINMGLGLGLQPLTPQALERGSVEALSEVRRLGGSGETSLLERYTKEQLDALKKIGKDLTTIVGAAQAFPKKGNP